MATTLTTRTLMAASPRSQLIRRYPLTAFFILAYALSWLYMIVDARGEHAMNR